MNEVTRHYVMWGNQCPFGYRHSFGICAISTKLRKKEIFYFVDIYIIHQPVIFLTILVHLG